MLISCSRTAERRIWEPAINGSSKMMRFKPRINQSLVRVNLKKIIIPFKSLSYKIIISTFFNIFSTANYEDSVHLSQDRVSPYFQMTPGQETRWGNQPPMLKSLQFS